MFTIEMTDTFGGETNYSWVKRFEVDNLPFDDNRKLLKIVREKLELGNAKLKLNCDSGQMKAWDISGACIRVMVYW